MYNFVFRPGGGGGKQYFCAKEWRVGGCHHRKIYLPGNTDTCLTDQLSVARFHAIAHLLFKGTAEGLLVLHLEVQQSQRRTARLAGWGDQDD